MFNQVVMEVEIKNCAFQYYNGVDIVFDKSDLTFTEAKALFNENYIDMYNRTKDGLDIECAIWVNMSILPLTIVISQRQK